MSREQPALTQFQRKVEAKFGLVFDCNRSEQADEAFLARRSELGLSAEEYLRRLDNNVSEWEHLAELLTTPESYFFRHADHMQAFLEVAIPQRVAAHPEVRMLRILCVGCAHGEEPYTLSMLCLEQPDLLGGCELTIQGCDISPEALRRARQGIYTDWALRATPQSYRDRYFEKAGKKHRIIEEVRRPVTFETCNALELYTTPKAETFDIVFFRNVLIYFSPAAIRASISGLAHLLASGGFLFLGPAETLRGISTDFELVHTHETFYYRRNKRVGSLIPFPPIFKIRAKSSPERRSTEEARATAATHLRPGDGGSLSPNLLLGGTGTEWMDEIQSSTRRIAQLHTKPTATRPTAAKPNATGVGQLEEQPSPPASATATVSQEIERIRSILSAERYAEALTSIDDLTIEIQRDPDIQLLRSLAHLNCRQVERAEAICRELLSHDGLNASAHYTLALCREYAHDHANALGHDQTAAYLDPAFAMPHLHLALIARKDGDSHTAQREFELAELLLAREDASRILVFGGGFSREGLRDLCRRELEVLGRA